MTAGYDYIAHHYGVRFEVGQRVREPINQRAGTVLPANTGRQHYVMVRLDGDYGFGPHHPLELEILPPPPEVEDDGFSTFFPKLPQSCGGEPPASSLPGDAANLGPRISPAPLRTDGTTIPQSRGSEGHPFQPAKRT